MANDSKCYFCNIAVDSTAPPQAEYRACVIGLYGSKHQRGNNIDVNLRVCCRVCSRIYSLFDKSLPLPTLRRQMNEKRRALGYWFNQAYIDADPVPPPGLPFKTYKPAKPDSAASVLDDLDNDSDIDPAMKKMFPEDYK